MSRAEAARAGATGSPGAAWACADRVAGRSMPVTPSSLSWFVIVIRLWSAGCVFAEDEAAVLISGAATPAELPAMVDRRAAGLLLEQVVGWAGFCGLRIAVDPGVFVLRRRTEFLVCQAIALASPWPVIVDLCCGSGAV